jgi:hypothetical protein
MMIHAVERRHESAHGNSIKEIFLLSTVPNSSKQSDYMTSEPVNSCSLRWMSSTPVTIRNWVLTTEIVHWHHSLTRSIVLWPSLSQVFYRSSGYMPRLLQHSKFSLNPLVRQQLKRSRRFIHGRFRWSKSIPLIQPRIDSACSRLDRYQLEMCEKIADGGNQDISGSRCGSA